MSSIIKVDNIQNQSGDNIIKEDSNTITLGASGDTVTLASGASQTGFGRTGTVNWDTTPKTSAFTGVSGNGYFVDVSSSAITVTLPASPSANDIVAVSDYAQNANTNNITLARNGSNIQGDAEDLIIQRKGVAITLVFVDATKGWIVTDSGAEADKQPDPEFIVACGGTETTCGNFKIHTFTGPGTFTVSCAGNPLGSETVEYIVVAGGGSGGNNGGGGGAGGFRFASPTLAPATYPGKPLAAPTSLPVSVQGYPITVGGGGTGAPYDATPTGGVNSTFSSITSTGGGRGGTNPGANATGVGTGGSGGGGSYFTSDPPATGGAGNTPPVSPPQGNPGGNTGAGPYPSGAPATGSGGGGAMAAGGGASSSLATGGPGGVGAGIPSAFGANGQSSGGQRYYSGGGGGASQNSSPGDKGVGGLGGGASSGLQECTASSATANTGGGGGGSAGGAGVSGNGGSGVVIIRYKFQ